MPTGNFCTNYKAEVEALILAAETIHSRAGPNIQVVFLSDALSVLQAFNSSQLPQLERALGRLCSLRTVLQWVPSHCGIRGNEQADKLAKAAAREEQPDHPVTFEERKSTIKALYRPPSKSDDYHLLSREDQVTILRLRTGHNRLRRHLHRKMKAVPSPLCPCGEAEQDSTHVLQDCRALQQLREELWPTPTPIEEKLHGRLESLTTTAAFMKRSGLQV